MTTSEEHNLKRRRNSQDESSEDTDTQIETVFKDWEERKRAILADEPKRKKRKSVPSDERCYREWRDENRPKVSFQSLYSATRLLSLKKPKSSVYEDRIRKYCKGESSFSTSYDSTTCIMTAIRRCILTRNWSRLTELLLVFMRVNKNTFYRGYVKEVCLSLFMKLIDFFY